MAYGASIGHCRCRILYLFFTSRGVKVIVDGDSIRYIDGTEIDFASDGFSTAFRFKNPNVADECGCGESFTVNPS